MGMNKGTCWAWRNILGQLSFFALKFWFPALIAAAVFPSLIAYSGPVFSALALWIVAGALVAGLVISLAQGYRIGSKCHYRTLAVMVESQLGRLWGSFTAASSIFSLVLAVSALVSTSSTFLVVALELPDWWRFLLVLLGFCLLYFSLLKAALVRKCIPIVTLLVFLTVIGILAYGYLNYFRTGSHPGLWQLLSGSALAKNALTSSYFAAGWQAISVAALLFVPVSPPVALFRDEVPDRSFSNRGFHILGFSSAVFFALVVYLSFTVKGFDWMRLDTVVLGPGNLVLLLGVILGEKDYLVVPFMSVLALGCLFSAYIYLSSASSLLSDLGKHNLLVHQVPLSWRNRGYSATVLVFLFVSALLAAFSHTRMDLVVLAWVFFVSVSNFIGQVARFKMWRQNFWVGDTYRERSTARRNIAIALISVAISLAMLVVVTLGFNSGWQLFAVVLWVFFSFIILMVNHAYRASTKKVAAVMRSSECLKRSIALVLVPDFSASSTKAVRYAWAAHHPHVEVVRVVDDWESYRVFRDEWARLGLEAPLTLLEAKESDHIGAVAHFVRSLLDADRSTTVSVYLPRQLSAWCLFGFMYNATQRAYARRLGRMSRVTVTWVELKP